MLPLSFPSLSSSSSMIPSWWWVESRDPRKQAGTLPRRCSHRRHRWVPADLVRKIMRIQELERKVLTWILIPLMATPMAGPMSLAAPTLNCQPGNLPPPRSESPDQLHTCPQGGQTYLWKVVRMRFESIQFKTDPKSFHYQNGIHLSQK